MSELPETRPQILYEIDCWEDIISSPKWVVFAKLIRDHCAYLQKEVNKKVEEHDDRGAGESRRAMKDCEKILELVRVRLEQLRKQADKKEK